MCIRDRGVLSLGISKGMEIDIIAEGPDEELAVKSLQDLISKNFSSI